MALGEFFKRHPYLSGIGGVVIFILFYMMFAGGSSGGSVATVGGMSSADYQATVAASTQLQAAQMANEQQTQQLNDQFQLGQAQIAAQTTAATLAANTQQNQDALAAQIAALQSNNQTAVAEQSNTLQAQVATAQINSTNQMAALTASVQKASLNTQASMNANNNATQLGIVQALATQNVNLAQIQGNSNVAAIKAKSSMCFITTMVCEVMGKADDCEELQSLREYRDKWIARQVWGKEILANYEIVGPIIVEYIKGRSDKLAYCERLYSDYIAPAVNYIEREYVNDALAIYLELVNKCLKDACTI